MNHAAEVADWHANRALEAYRLATKEKNYDKQEELYNTYTRHINIADYLRG